MAPETVTVSVTALVKVLATCDGGCPTCTGDIAAEMESVAPGFDWWRLIRAELGRP